MTRRGFLAGLIAYVIWGLFPLYWPLLKPAGAVEILAHRMIWSLLIMAIVVTVLRRWRALRSLDARTWGLLALASALISVNWGLYIYAVNNGRVLDASLGYFLNPLLSVALGVLILGERLRPVQWLAVGLGAVSVVVIATGGGTFPWIACCLAASFGCYGLVKKTVRAEPTVSLTAEGIVQFVPAVAAVAVIQATGHGTMTGNGAGHVLLMIGTGLLTVIPLLSFGIAAKALPLTVLGLMQYLTPVMQFVLAVTWFGEHMPLGRWIGFGLIWCALVVLSLDLLRGRRHRDPAPLAG